MSLLNLKTKKEPKYFNKLAEEIKKETFIEEIQQETEKNINTASSLMIGERGEISMSSIREDLRARIDFIESAYEFMLAYAAQGRAGLLHAPRQGSSTRKSSGCSSRSPRSSGRSRVRSRPSTTSSCSSLSRRAGCVCSSRIRSAHSTIRFTVPFPHTCAPSNDTRPTRESRGSNSHRPMLESVRFVGRTNKNDGGFL